MHAFHLAPHLSLFMSDFLRILPQKTASRPDIGHLTKLHEWIKVVFIYFAITECFSNVIQILPTHAEEPFLLTPYSPTLTQSTTPDLVWILCITI